jgi:hypothetical protein
MAARVDEMKFRACSVLLAALFTMAACLCGCENDQVAAPNGNANAGGEGSLIQRVDKHGDEVLASNSKVEAREWLKDSAHVFFKGGKKKTAKFVEDFYAAGAKQVLIGDIESHEGKDFGGCLLVVLPPDTAARAKLIEVDKQAAGAFEEDPVSDQGQKYLYYTFD